MSSPPGWSLKGSIHKPSRPCGKSAVDISRQQSKHVDDLPIKEFDYIITLCDHAAQNCPVFLGKGVRLHHGFSDPAAVQGKEQNVLEAFRKVRDELKQFILAGLILTEQYGIRTG